VPDERPRIPAKTAEAYGVTFRSRLEYHWSVFLTTAGIPWEYEVRVFSEQGQRGYLPDFYLPEMKTWLEIKPTWPNDTEIEKAKMLTRLTGETMYFLVGPPSPISERGFFRFYFVPCTPEGLQRGLYYWSRCPRCERIGIALKGLHVNHPCGCARAESAWWWLDPSRNLGTGHETPYVLGLLAAAGPRLAPNEKDPEFEDDEERERRIGDLLLDPSPRQDEGGY
jgi:hypothetical protein